MKVVLDTNVLIAAFATRGLCEAVFEHCLERHEIVLSEPILLEVEEKLEAKLSLSEAVARDLVAFLRSHTTLVEPSEVAADACTDPDDLVVLGTAEACDAKSLVTGDRDLLLVEQYAGIPILTPRMFWEREAEKTRDT